MAIMDNSGGNRPAGAVVTAISRPIARDISIPALQQARSSGIVMSQQNLAATQEAMGVSSDPTQALITAIKVNTDIEVALKLLKLGYQGFVFNLTAGEQIQIIAKAKTKRGYIIINPAEVSGFSTTITFFPSLARAAATYTSAAFNVSGVDTARVFMDITANATPLTITVNAQSQDPLSGNWATTQTDLFGGSNAVGTYYADIGPLGVDRNIRLQAVVGAGAGTATFSVSGLLKGGALTPSGSTVYVGPINVTPIIGYPILPGQREYFWLDDDVEMFAISPTEPMTIKVFQLQG